LGRGNRSSMRKKTVTRTFRIRNEWDSVLQEEAARQGVSVNVLLNKLLRKYSLYSRWSERKNYTSFPRQTLREILKTVQVDSLAEAGTKSGALDAVNIVNSMGLALNYESFIYLITEHLGGPHFARWFKCFHHTQGNKDIFHLQHDLGPEWSVFLEKYITSFLGSMTDKEATTRVYDYAVTLEVKHPK
jgi:predicted DNA-binding ribbon-helix-helix protein